MSYGRICRVLSSMLLFKCRTNTLNLNDRKRFKEESTECKLCGYEREDLRHFLLWCPSYVLPRKKNEAMHQPYEDNEENIIGKLLFGNNSKKNKETIRILENQRNKIERDRPALVKTYRKRQGAPLRKAKLPINNATQGSHLSLRYFCCKCF